MYFVVSSFYSKPKNYLNSVEKYLPIGRIVLTLLLNIFIKIITTAIHFNAAKPEFHVYTPDRYCDLSTTVLNNQGRMSAHKAWTLPLYLLRALSNTLGKWDTLCDRHHCAYNVVRWLWLQAIHSLFRGRQAYDLPIRWPFTYVLLFLRKNCCLGLHGMIESSVQT